MADTNAIQLTRRMQLGVLSDIEKMSTSVSKLANNQLRIQEQQSVDKEGLFEIIRCENAKAFAFIPLNPATDPNHQEPGNIDNIWYITSVY